MEFNPASMTTGESGYDGWPRYISGGDAERLMATRSLGITVIEINMLLWRQHRVLSVHWNRLYADHNLADDPTPTHR